MSSDSLFKPVRERSQEAALDEAPLPGQDAKNVSDRGSP
jgi:hypothetical protein